MDGTPSLDQAIKFIGNHQTEGDLNLAQNKFAEALLAYQIGSHIAPLIHPGLSYSQYAVQMPLDNAYNSQESDLNRLSCQATNKLVEARRDRETCAIKDIELEVLDTAIVSAGRSFWAGISDFQRADSHFCRGIAFKNRAEYKQLHGNSTQSAQARQDYEEAAKDLFYALQLRPQSVAISQALRHVDLTITGLTGTERKTSESHARMQEVVHRMNGFGLEG